MVGCVVHDVPASGPAPAERLRAALARRGLRLIAAVPHRPELAWLRVRDLVLQLRPQVLSAGDQSRRIKDVAVFAQGVPGGLRVLTDGRLVVVPGDRHDVVMAACLAALNGTRLAALLLSTGTAPDPRVWELARAATATGLPVLMVGQNSYETATLVGDLDPGLPADDTERIEGVTGNIADALDQPWLESLRSPARPRRAQPCRVPLPACRDGPRGRCPDSPARRDRTPDGTGRGRVRRAGHRPQRPAGATGPGDRGGPQPGTTAARGHHRDRSRCHRRAVRDPARHAPTAPRLDRATWPASNSPTRSRSAP